MKAKLVYCNKADITFADNNVIKSQRLYTGIVKNNKLVTIEPEELNSGDIIHFLPVIPIIGVAKVNGEIAAVSRVVQGGFIILGNLKITQEQMRRISDLHVSGRI